MHHTEPKGTSAEGSCDRLSNKGRSSALPCAGWVTVLAILLTGTVTVTARALQPKPYRLPDARAADDVDLLSKAGIDDGLLGARRKRSSSSTAARKRYVGDAALIEKYQALSGEARKRLGYDGTSSSAELQRQWLADLLAGEAASSQRRVELSGAADQTLGHTAGGSGRTLLIASAGIRNITRYDAETGEFIGFFVPTGIGGRTKAHMTWGPDGNLYVASVNGVLRYAGDHPHPLSECLGLAPGAPCAGPNGTPGSDEFVPNGSGGLSESREAAFGPDGHLYVASLFSNEILQYNGVTGAFTNVFVASGSGGLSLPGALAFGPDGNLYVASIGTSEVLRYDGVTGDFIDVFASACQNAPPPDNDDCASAHDLVHPGGDPANDIVLEYDTRCATEGEPEFVASPDSPGSQRTIWYSYEAPCNGTLTLSTCQETNFDSRVFIFESPEMCTFPAKIDETNAFASDDDGCGVSGGPAFLRTGVTEGTCYKILIGGFDGGSGTGTLAVSMSCDGGASVPAEPTGGGSAGLAEGCDTLLLNAPRALRFGPDGDLYVAAISSDNVVRFDGDTGAFVDTVVCPRSGGLSDPRDLRFGPDDGHLYVTSWPVSVMRYDGVSGAPLPGPLGTKGTAEFVSDADNISNPFGLIFAPVCGDARCEAGESLCNCVEDCPLPPEFDDCNVNGVPDLCESNEDCNGNGVLDFCELYAGTASDCNENLVPDECEPNTDCNTNGVQDICDIADGAANDCNGNLLPDICDLGAGTSSDCNLNTVPDECERDCNGNLTPDECDIDSAHSPDTNTNGVPDECERPVLFVDASATGARTGISWPDAYVDLQDALATAAGSEDVVEEIRVAQGIYRPDRGTGDRSATFQLQSGVRLAGGYAGVTGDDPDERNVDMFETVLSGDLSGNDAKFGPAEDSCQNASPIDVGEILFDNRGATTDGPNPVDCEYGPEQLGADIWYVYTHSCDSEQVRVSLCRSSFDTFIAVYDGDTCPPTDELACNDDGCGPGGPSDLVFPAVRGGRYLLRVGGWDGATGIGAIDITCDTLHTTDAENSYHVVTGNGADATAILDGFTVTAGNADGVDRDTWGGGMIVTEGPTPGPTLVDCTFRRNRAERIGGGVIGFGSTLTVLNCLFDGNAAGNFAGLLLFSDGHSTVSNCTFTRNVAAASGGGLSVFSGSATVTNSFFLDNTASQGAGAWNYLSTATYTDCGFVGNSAAGRAGGLMVHEDAVVNIVDSTFRSNTASEGGGVFMAGTDLTLDGCTFRGNSADFGGGLRNVGAVNPSINSCLFIGNIAFDKGGAIDSLDNSNPVLTGCTVVSNFAGFDGVGGGIYSLGSSPTLTSTILWGNSDGTGISESSQIVTTFGTAVVNYSLIQGLTGDLGGTDNIDANPLLTPDGRLRAGSPCIDAGNPSYVLDPASPFDIDGDLRVLGGRVDIGADEFSDLDLDRLPDSWELKYFHGTTDGIAADDSDGDGLSNLDEYERYSSNPIATPYYVAGQGGRDANDGRSPDPEGHGTGPKKTIQAALDVAGDGDTVVVLPQNQPYRGAGNRELDYQGKSVVVRSDEGPEATTIDLEGSGRAIDFESILGTSATLAGFTITGGGANIGGAMLAQETGLQIRDCILDTNRAGAGGGLLSRFANPTIDDVTLANNTAFFADSGIFNSSSVNLEGALSIDTGTVAVFSSWFDGPGRIELMPDALLHVTGPIGNSPTVLRSDLLGVGDVWIDPERELRVEGGAVVDLSGGTGAGSCADPARADLWGTIFVNLGTLFVRDATIQNTNVEVTIADFEDDTEIINNDITLLDASAGFGGQFFVDGTAVVQCNTIVSEGDRYLDLDPDPLADPRPLIQDNRFYVVITQGAQGEQGEIFDLRVQDFDCIGDCPSGAFEVPTSAGYDDEWVLEELTLLPDTKLNLTNRQGMVFQDPTIPTPETLYVKDLILGSGATLNTAFERLYYQRLTDEFGMELVRDPENPTAPLANGGRIVDIPLLGFSLGIIGMNDDTEFDVRVRTRTTDPADVNPDDPFAELPQGVVRRLIEQDPDPDGLLNLRTFGASSVSAKGAFARATEDSIIVSFQYLFKENPDSELVVYLSDVADPGATGCPLDQAPCCDLDPSHPLYDEHRCEIARVYPPPAGRRGASDSEEFATFHGAFPRGSLDFIRGTYVELELRNAGSQVWIDEWDPVVCNAVCGSFSGETFVTGHADYLYLLSDYGQQVRGSDQECADSPLNGDGYVDVFDLVAWELYYDDHGLFNLCGDGTTASAAALATPVDVPAGTILIAGKSTQGSEDALYTLDPGGTCTGDRLSPASSPGPNGYRANGRVSRDASGTLYQLHSRQGLIRLSDAQVVIPPSGLSLPSSDTKVLVGTWPENGGPRGVPIQDVAFHPTDDSVVYVAPIQVEPAKRDAYKAAAKLRLTGSPEPFVIERLYGTQPVNGDGCCNSDPCSASECSVNHPREIEVLDGRVFVTSSRINGDDWLLMFDEATGAEQARIQLDVPSPTALTLSSTGQIYMASAMEDDDSTGTELYRYTLDESGPDPALVLASTIRIDHMRQITAVAESSEDGSMWVTGFDAPTFDEFDVFYDDDPLFTTPMLAVVTDGATSVAAAEITCHDLALPLSMVFNMGCPASGDAEPDGNIDLKDFAALQRCMTGPGGAYEVPACSALDADCDGDIDQHDFKNVAVRLTDPVK